MPRTSSKPLNVAVNKYLRKIPMSQAQLAKEVGMKAPELNRRLANPDNMTQDIARNILRVLIREWVITSRVEAFELLEKMQVKLPNDDEALKGLEEGEMTHDDHYESSSSEHVSEEAAPRDNKFSAFVRWLETALINFGKMIDKILTILPVWLGFILIVAVIAGVITGIIGLAHLFGGH